MIGNKEVEAEPQKVEDEEQLWLNRTQLVIKLAKKDAVTLGE